MSTKESTWQDFTLPVSKALRCVLVLVHSKGESLIFTSETRVKFTMSPTSTGSTPTKLHTADHAERSANVKRLVKENIHDQGRSAPLTNVSFRDIYKFNPTREVCV